MDNAQIIINRLKKDGFKSSEIRDHLINYLAICKKPHAAYEILKILKVKKPSIHKTTIYRELYFLKDRGLVQELDFGDGKKRYEINPKHHHHIICIKCGKVADIPFDNDLSKHEKRIEETMNFKVKSHSLEFFGTCKLCQL